MSSESTKTNIVEPDVLETQYLETLTPRERQAYHIAKDHLGMSFTLRKSNGYLDWLKSQKDAK